MTFANHHERQFMQRLRGAGWVKASALPSSPGLVQKLLQKGWIETQSGPKTDPLSADRKGFGGQEAAHPNPTEKATVLEGEMISLVATRKLVINN
jgi:hypothetical protein